MKEQEIIEGNRLIAEFIGAKPCKDWQGFDGYSHESYQHGQWSNRFQDTIQLESYRYSELKYYYSWDWLMLVVEKIEDLDPSDRVSHMYSVAITGNGSSVYKNLYSGNDHIIARFNMHNSRLLCTWIVIVEFIKWYNEKNSKKKEE